MSHELVSSGHVLHIGPSQVINISIESPNLTILGTDLRLLVVQIAAERSILEIEIADGSVLDTDRGSQILAF